MMAITQAVGILKSLPIIKSNEHSSVGGQEIAIRSILDFYVISEMIPVGGGSFGANLGGTFWSKDKGVMGVS